MSAQPPATPPASPNPAANRNPTENPNPQEKKKSEDRSKEPQIRSAAFWIIIVALLILWLIGWRWSGCGPWIHLLLLVALAALLVELLGGNSKNIDAHSDDIPNWDPVRPEVSLTEIHLYVLDEAAKSTQWYWKNKGSKAFLSRLIRFAVWALAAVGGLLPIIGALLEDHFSNLNLTNGLWASLLLGIAAALLGLDKGFGFSSGWARYVLTATNIRKSLEEFRLDWTVLRAKAGSTLTAENVAPLIERAKQFRSDIEGLVLQETKDWVTEFQSTMQQMEKDVAAQLSTLKAQVDKTLKEKQDAATPGALHVEVQSNGKTGPNTVQVTITDSSRNEIVKEMTKGFSWFGSLVPGDYLVSIAVPGNNSISLPKDQLVTLKAGDPAKTLTFAL